MIHLENQEQRHRWGRRRRSGGNQKRRAIVVALVFVLVIFMALTSLDLFGQTFADAVRHLIRG
jgi:hypothetical protein